MSEFTHRESALRGIWGVGKNAITALRAEHREKRGVWFDLVRLDGRMCVAWSDVGLREGAAALASRRVESAPGGGNGDGGEGGCEVAATELPAVQGKRETVMQMVRPIPGNSRCILAQEVNPPPGEPARLWRAIVRKPELFVPKTRDGKPFVFPVRITGPGVAELRGRMPRARGKW